MTVNNNIILLFTKYVRIPLQVEALYMLPGQSQVLRHTLRTTIAMLRGTSSQPLSSLFGLQNRPTFPDSLCDNRVQEERESLHVGYGFSQTGTDTVMLVEV